MDNVEAIFLAKAKEFEKMYIPRVTLDDGIMQIAWGSDIWSPQGEPTLLMFNRVISLLRMMNVEFSRDTRLYHDTVITVENVTYAIFGFVKKFIDDGYVIKL